MYKRLYIVTETYTCLASVTRRAPSIGHYRKRNGPWLTDVCTCIYIYDPLEVLKLNTNVYKQTVLGFPFFLKKTITTSGIFFVSPGT